MTTLTHLVGPVDTARLGRCLRASDDPDIQVAALLYTTWGVQTSPHVGWNRCPRPPLRLPVNPLNDTVRIPPRLHAEETVLLAAYRAFDSAEGGRMILTWFPCAHCAALIIEAGVESLVAQRFDPNHSKWGESWCIAQEILEDAGVRLIYYDHHGLQDGRS